MEASLKMCYTYLKGIVEGADEETGKKSNKTVQTQLKNDSTFQALLREIAGQQNSKGGFRPHPKMEQLKMLLIQHFGGRLSDGEGGDGANEGNTQETRAMVFVTNRGCVDEIEEILNEERPLIRATRFIGQGTDKQGKKGFAQKEQLDVSFLSVAVSCAKTFYSGLDGVDRSSRNLKTGTLTCLFPRLLVKKALILEKSI